MKSLERDGFEIAPDCLPLSTVDALTAALENSPLHRSRAGMRNVLQLEAVRALALDPLLLNLAKASLGFQALPFRATLFDKSSDSNWLVVWHQDTALPLRQRKDVPGWGPWSVKEGVICAHAPAETLAEVLADSNWLVVWHQDTALPLRQRKDVPGWGPWSVKEGVICAHAPAETLAEVLAIRIHLDASTIENGPLRVLPGTHKSGVLSDDAIHYLSLKVTEAVCQVPLGGLLLMKPLLVHASSKVLQSKRRRVLHIEYCSQATFPGGLELPVMC